MFPDKLFMHTPNSIWATLSLTQGYLSTHALDRNNMGLCFDTYWDAVSKVIIQNILKPNLKLSLMADYGLF